MGSSRSVHFGAETAEGWPRPALEGPSGRLEWHSMGVADGRPVGRPSQPASVYQTCHRRFQHWVGSGVMKGIFEALAETLQARARLDVVNPLLTEVSRQPKRGS